MSEREAGESRRGFLRLASVGAAAAGVAAATGETAAAAEPSTGKVSAGYAETDHVKTYLETCRF